MSVIKLHDLLVSDIEKIHELYEEYCGVPGTSFKERMDKTPEEIFEEIKNGGNSYKVGSRWTSESKFIMKKDWEENVIFGFYGNFPKEGRWKEYRDAKEADEKFRQSIMNYKFRR